MSVQVTDIDPAAQADLLFDMEQDVVMFRNEGYEPFLVRQDDGSVVKMKHRFHSYPLIPTVPEVDAFIKELRRIAVEGKKFIKRIDPKHGWIVAVTGNDGTVDIHVGRTIADLWREKHGMGGGATDRLKGSLAVAGAV